MMTYECKYITKELPETRIHGQTRPGEEIHAILLFYNKIDTETHASMWENLRKSKLLVPTKRSLDSLTAPVLLYLHKFLFHHNHC